MIKFSSGAVSIAQFAEIKSLEQSADLPVLNDRYVPTIPFLADLADLLRAFWRKTVTPTEAWQVWIALYDVTRNESKKLFTQSEVAYWYGVNPSQLTELEIAAYHGNLPRVKAQQRLESGNFDSRDFDGVFNLMMLAYDDERRALDARADSIRAAMNKEG